MLSTMKDCNSPFFFFFNLERKEVIALKYESNYYSIEPVTPENTLQQHGIIGMKWGVWNEETRNRYLGSRKRKSKNANDDVKYYSHNIKKANDIYKTLTDEEKHHLTGNVYDDNAPYYDKKYESSQRSYNRASVYSFLTEVKDVPVSLIDVYDHDGIGLVSIMVRNDEKYRGKGYAKESVKRALDWFEQNPDILQLDWAAHYDNVGSQKLAEEMGFKLNKAETDDKVKIYSIKKKGGKK